MHLGAASSKTTPFLSAMIALVRTPAKALAALPTKVYRAVGFSKAYNFWLWLILGGVLFAFTVIHLPFLDFDGVFCGPEIGRGRMNTSSPGECFYFSRPGRFMSSIKTHMWTFLPASLLACGQFTPVFRRKALWLHRINGWISAVLSLIGAIFVLPLMGATMGGGLDSQSMSAVLVVLFSVSLCYGALNARRHKVQEHRNWMLRSWVYACSIISLRIILPLANIGMSLDGTFYQAMRCDQVEYMMKGQHAATAEFRTKYPDCAPYWLGNDPNRHVVVHVDVLNRDPVAVAAARHSAFGMSGWMAILLHFIGVELYLYLTSPERKVSAGDKPVRRPINVEGNGETAKKVV